MYKKNLYGLSIFLSFLLGACASAPVTVTTANAIIPVASETPLEATSTPTAPMVASTPEIPSCWKEPVWPIDPARRYDPYGPLRDMEESPENVFWLLYYDALVWQPDNGKASIFRFQEMLGCDKCQDIINGSMAVSPEGDAWLGLSTGLLVVDRQGAWKQIPVGEILPIPSDTSNVHVLLYDQNGNIWVSNRNRLCYYDGAEWVCKVLDEVNVVLSAVSGKADQIWFAASFGKIIHFDDGEFAVYDLAEMSPSMYLSDIGSMAYDAQTDTLWAASLDPPGCSESENGVIQRNADGDWSAYKKRLFAREQVDFCFYPLTSIAVTPDGKVWLGMVHRHGLVYFDGLDWRTLAGKKLPYISDTQLPSDSKCALPEDYIVDLLVTHDGSLLVGTYSHPILYIGNHNDNSSFAP